MSDIDNRFEQILKEASEISRRRDKLANEFNNALNEAGPEVQRWGTVSDIADVLDGYLESNGDTGGLEFWIPSQRC